jgi:hypothetical protein
MDTLIWTTAMVAVVVLFLRFPRLMFGGLMLVLAWSWDVLEALLLAHLLSDD